jgi:hypothetical protein
MRGRIWRRSCRAAYRALLVKSEMDMALRNAKQHQVLSLASAAPSQHSIWEVVVTMQNNFRSYLSAKLGRDFAGRAAGLLSIFSPWRLRAFAPLRCYRLKTATCRDVRVGSVLRFLNLLHWKRIGMNNKYRVWQPDLVNEKGKLCTFKCW